MPPVLVRMLDLMNRPGFLVKDGKILHCNSEAKALHISADTPLTSLLGESIKLYESFHGEILHMQIFIQEQPVSATVERLDDHDLFYLEQMRDNAALSALAMASNQLTMPITGLMNAPDKDSPQANRLLYQLHRAVRNMSDALRYSQEHIPQLQVQELSAWLAELTEAVASRTESLGLKVTYQGPGKAAYCPIDEDLLKRAILNLISNSVKSGATALELRLTQRTDMLSITVSDNGAGVPEDLRAQVFDHYKRQPSLMDSQYGLGLGMVIVKAAAAAHDGCVLLEHKAEGGLNVTLTLSAGKQDSLILRSPVMHFDFTGGRDAVLTELADILPSSEY